MELNNIILLREFKNTYDYYYYNHYLSSSVLCSLKTVIKDLKLSELNNWR